MTPRILFVAPRVPFPPNIGWNQRMFHSLRALSAVGTVDLVCGREEPFVDVDLGPLEALALGVPVVSTTLGAEGLDLVPGREIVLADAPEAFAEAVVRLLTDRVAREALGRAGRAAVARAYDWSRIEARLGDEVRGWFAARSRRGVGWIRLMHHVRRCTQREDRT